jgi:hypothetical protein
VSGNSNAVRRAIVDGDIASSAGIAGSKLGDRDPKLAPSRIKILPAGHSFVTGSSPAPGGLNIALSRVLDEAGFDYDIVGPYSQLNNVSVGRADSCFPRHGGHAGDTTEQTTTLFAPGGAIATYIAANGQPDIVTLDVAVNNCAAGESAASMTTKDAALLAQVRATCPSALVLFIAEPHLYSPVSPAGGLSAANAAMDARNASLASVVAADALADVVDGSSLLLGDISTVDGTHPTPSGQAIRGRAIGDRILRYVPGRFGRRHPRDFRLRPNVAMAQLVSKAADTMASNSADVGFQLPAGNFAVMLDFEPSDLAQAGGTTPILQSTPSGQNYSHGWLIAHDSVNGNFNVYLKSLSGQLSCKSPLVANTRYKLMVHGDRANGIVSAWLAYRPNLSGARVVVGCFGFASGVSAWAAGDANPILSVGKNPSFGGFAGYFGGIEFFSGSAVPPFGVDVRNAFLDAVYDGRTMFPGARTGFVPVTEGSGTAVASGMSGIAYTLAGGTTAWRAAASDSAWWGE